jgi:hypothetical protein
LHQIIHHALDDLQKQFAGLTSHPTILDVLQKIPRNSRHDLRQNERQSFWQILPFQQRLKWEEGLANIEYDIIPNLKVQRRWGRQAITPQKLVP